MTKTFKKIFLTFLLIILSISIFSISFAASRWYTLCVLSVWSVDSGKHLDWSGSTQYSSNWNTGVNTWNNYISGVIRQDTISTINDVTISDVPQLTGNVIATTTQYGTGHSSNSTIQFSVARMNTLTNLQRTIVCSHEIGHTLGLDENQTSYSHIMFDDITYNSSNNVLSSEDKSNYTYMYNNKY